MSRTTRAFYAGRHLAGAIRWWGPLLAEGGAGEDSRGFVTTLRGLGAPVAARPIGPRSPGLLEGFARADMGAARLLGEALGQASDSVLLDIVQAAGDMVTRLAEGVPTVAYTSFDAYGLPASWVMRLNDIDEVWVPSTFNAESFRSAGVKVPVVVLPGGVDTHRFRPGLAPFRITGSRSNVFLSSFAWSRMKGPDLLLRAWARAFGSDADATLVLLCDPGSPGGTGDITSEVEKLVQEELSAIGIERSAVAPIVVIGRALAPEEVARLLASATAYVSPARGEGFGRSMLEALSCGVPVVATSWGGQMDFLSDANSYLIDVEAFVELDELSNVPAGVAQRWAEPSVDHLVELMREVLAKPDEARARGRAGRRDAVARWQWKQAGLRSGAELERLLSRSSHAGIEPEGRAGGSIRSGMSLRVRLEGDIFASHSLARVNRELAVALANRGDLDLEVLATDSPPYDEDVVERLSRVEGLRVPGVTGTAGASSPAVEIRHRWPPRLGPKPWRRKLVVMQPWEFGPVPASWMAPLRSSANMIFTLSSANRQCFIESGLPDDMVRVVSAGVDVKLFTPDGPIYPLGNTRRVRFLFVGGTIYRKAFDVLLDAYCATFSPSDDVCLVVKDSLAGGHYQGMTMGAAIAERSRDPGSPAIEVIDGDLSDGDLAALYRACDVLILASRGEAFGLPAAEAMACGKPVMVTAGTGCADFADEDVAWVIPSTSLPLEVPGHLPATGTFRVLEPDREHLSRALLSAASDERVRREKASCARRRIVEGFTWEHMAARVDALLHELTGDGRG